MTLLRAALCGLLLSVFTPVFIFAQDSATASLSGLVLDPSGARIVTADVRVINLGTAASQHTRTDAQGRFAFSQLPPDDYSLTVIHSGFTTAATRVTLDVGAALELPITLRVAGPHDTVTVVDPPAANPEVDARSTALSHVVDPQAIADLPLNGRRFTDLALLTPNVTQDPRSQTSASNGDLAVGGIRGFQTQFLVDGSDDNNAFFSQARGRYRAPYQFSNDVIQEFRVSTAGYSAEQGRSGSAVVDVVTRSGSNTLHGKLFYFLRDDEFNARHPFVDFKPRDRQQQFGFTLGGPIRKERVFYFLGFDQHVFHVPNVVEFGNGSTILTPAANDYEITDQSLVFASAAQLSTLGGEFRSSLLGNAAFAKLDFILNDRNHLTLRANTSRYYGDNNVFFDPASPVTNFALASNGTEEVSTETIGASLLSQISSRLNSHLRVQFSRDLQQSAANSSDVLTKISGILAGIGRSNILPRLTNEHRLHLAESLSWTVGRHELKWGFDFLPTWITSDFPRLAGGEYLFDDISVNPFTFAPQKIGGLPITPLRAYAHDVPRYYIQDFGPSTTHPDSNEYSAFVQDTIRLGSHLTITAGLRYDLQTFTDRGLTQNPLYPAAGHQPSDTNNFAPRFGFTYAVGNSRPLLFRGGYGIFYSRIPLLYTSSVQRENGVTNFHLFLDNEDFFNHLVFPSYPKPLVACPDLQESCAPPASVAASLTTEISAFSPNFQMPRSTHAHGSIEKELPGGFVLDVSYLYVHGERLTRARDRNLPNPVRISYPVYDESDITFTGSYYIVDSFATIQNTPTLTCPFPPCINPLDRPIPRIGAIKVFETGASSVYHGGTFSLSKRMSHGWYLRVAHTWANAVDDTQDALVAGSPVTVQNAYNTAAERGRSVTDQRHRFVAAWIWEPRLHASQSSAVAHLFNDWTLSGVFTAGSGRPFDARILNDANQDANTSNDRLPGVRRNSYLGPAYSTLDLRLTRSIKLHEKWRLELLAESFNLLNRDNQTLDRTDDGFLDSAGKFVFSNKTVGIQKFPAHFQSFTSFLKPTNAYAPRQVQFAAKLSF
jgi:carboxypeptidase family protein/TonB-dependent receptor-like protein